MLLYCLWFHKKYGACDSGALQTWGSEFRTSNTQYWASVPDTPVLLERRQEIARAGWLPLLMLMVMHGCILFTTSQRTQSPKWWSKELWCRHCANHAPEVTAEGWHSHSFPQRRTPAVIQLSQVCKTQLEKGFKCIRTSGKCTNSIIFCNILKFSGLRVDHYTHMFLSF